MRPIILSFVVLMIPLTSGTGPAQTTPPSGDQVPTIRARAEEVLLDMVVRDRHGHQVTDLRPQEIEIYEDGVRQEVKAFRVVQGSEQLETERSEAQASAPAKTPGNKAPAPTQTLKQLNFVSIIFGPTAQLNREFAREAVIDFLTSDSLPNTYVTLYGLSNSLKVVQPYTDNKKVLTAAVDRIAKGLPGASGQSASNQIASTEIANTLVNAANSTNASQIPTGPTDPMLGQFSGAIVTSSLWASDTASHDASTNLGSALEAQAFLSMALRFDASEGMATMDALRELVQSQARLPGRKVVLYLADGLAFPVGRRENVDNVISLANRLGVTFYTVDTRGLSTDDPLAPGRASMEMTGAESRQRGAVTSPVKGYKEMDDVELTGVSNRQLAMQELAESTGGFAVTNTNEIAGPMRRVMEDIRTHYELSYAPKSSTYDGHFRKIEVRLTRPKLTVQTRKGYYALPTLNGEPLQPFESKALDEINARPLPADLRYDAALMKFRSGQELVQYLAGFEIPIAELKSVPIAKTGKSLVRASIVALVRDAHGEVVGKIGRELERQVSAQDSGKTGDIFYGEPLALPRGNYTIDVAVTDELSGKSAVRRMAVPNDRGSGLGVSSLEIVEKAEPLSGARNPLNPLELDNVQIVPELSDSVAAGPVTLYFVLYPAKLDKPASTEATLELLRDGNVIDRQALKLAEPRPDGSIPVVLRVSPGPGSYAIVITAHQGPMVAESYRSLQIQ